MINRQEFDRRIALHQEHHFGPFRWRGHLNWKDITERVVSGSIVGLTAGGTFWMLTRLFG